jgi:stearoyl-CoA desaturase (Delta-9 desaturase)
MSQAAPRFRWDVLSIFAITGVTGLLVTPWYGLTHGFSGWLWMMFVVMLLWNGLSITAGYHRLWAHRAYAAHRIIRWIFALGGALAVQNSAWVWCSNHRRHHRFVDDDAQDPYSAGKGLVFSHIGWMLRDHPASKLDEGNIPDLMADPILAWQHQHYWAASFSLNVILTLALGALAGDAIGGLLLLGSTRLALCHHTTFFINSLAHFWGTQPYSDRNSARDNGIVALLTYGEGFHNFHHTFAWDYRNGLKWYQFDPTKWLIQSLALAGLASRLKTAAPEKIELCRLAMQRKHLVRSVSLLPRIDAEVWRSRIEEEYAQLNACLHEWARLRQQWLALRKGQLQQRWEETELRARMRELEEHLAFHKHQWRFFTAQFA